MASFEYVYSDLTSEPPGASEVRADAVPLDSTMLFVNYLPVGGSSIKDTLLALVVDEDVRLEGTADETYYNQFRVTDAPFDIGDAYAGIPVTWQSSGYGDPYGPVNLVLPDQPSIDGMLGPTDSYAPMSDLEAVLGAAAGEAQTRRAVSLLLASRWVAYRVGLPPNDEVIPPVITAVTAIPAKPAWRTATVAAAVRFYKAPDVPWGVAGGWDEAVYVRSQMPEVDLILFGQRQRWGIA